MDQRPICKTQNYKTSKKEHRKNVGALGFGNEFLDTTPKVWTMKENVIKWTLFKVKFSVLQKTPLREWRQATDWEKIFAKHISDKRWYPKYTKNS